jgi:hypothetical protein
VVEKDTRRFIPPPTDDLRRLEKRAFVAFSLSGVASGFFKIDDRRVVGLTSVNADRPRLLKPTLLIVHTSTCQKNIRTGDCGRNLKKNKKTKRKQKKKQKNPFNSGIIIFEFLPSLSASVRGCFGYFVLSWSWLQALM